MWIMECLAPGSWVASTFKCDSKATERGSGLRFSIAGGPLPIFGSRKNLTVADEFRTGECVPTIVVAGSMNQKPKAKANALHKKKKKRKQNKAAQGLQSNMLLGTGMLQRNMSASFYSCYSALCKEAAEMLSRSFVFIHFWRQKKRVEKHEKNRHFLPPKNTPLTASFSLGSWHTNTN